MPRNKTDFCCGVVPIHLIQGQPRFLLVKHHAGHWGFPKGHPDPDETHRQTAIRECFEETGIRFDAVDPSPHFEERYRITKKSGKVIDKTVRYFLGYATDTMVAEAKRQEEEIAEIAWGTAEQTMQRLTFDAGQKLFAEVLDHLRSQ